MSLQGSCRFIHPAWAAALREVIALGGQAQTTIAKVNAANMGRGLRSGNVAQRLQNTRTDTGM